MSILIYTKTGCPYCAGALKSLQQQGTVYEEVNLYDHPERIEEMINLAGTRKVPVMVDNDTITVGFNGGA